MRNLSKFGLEPSGLSTKLSTGGGVKPSNALVINTLRILCLGFMCTFSVISAFSQCTALPFTTVTTTWTISSGSPTYSGIYRIPIGQTLLITGSTTNVTFNGLHLQMEKDAKIELAAGATLNIIGGSRLYNCSFDAWNCVLINSGTSTLTVDNSIIEGSDFGIRNITGGNTFLTNASLFNNYNHFQLLTQISTTTTVMDGSLFLCNPTISPMPVSTVFPSNPRTVSAIQLTNAGAVILGSGSTGLNTIVNADLGIDIYNTSAEIYNFLIRDCDDRTPNIEGGIYARNPALGGFLNYIIVGGFSANEPVSVYNCELGIRASYGYNVKVYKNYLEDIQKHGISVLYNAFPNTIDIQENTLDMDYITTIASPMVGIYSLENSNGNVTISKNTVRLNGLSSGVLSNSQQAYGIRADEVSTTSSALIKVLGNEVYDFSIGIRLGNTKKAEVNADSVTIPFSTDIRRGIYLVNNDSLILIQNRVLSDTLTSNPNHRGINTQSDNNTIIRCNRVWDGGRQIFLQSTTSIGTDVFMGNGMRHTSTNSALIGLVLSSSLIGTNGSLAIPSDNRWETPFTNFCLTMVGFSSGNIYHRANTFGAVFNPSAALCQSGGGMTYTPSTSTPAYYCAGELMREAGEDPIDPSLLITYENAATFISSLKNKSFQTIWDLQNAASLFSLNIIPENDSLITIFSEFAFAEEALRMEQVKNHIRNSDFGQALDLLQSHTWELEGFAYQAWMNILNITNPIDAEGNYDDATIGTLTTIANLCPYIYGSAVYEARTKLQWGDSEESEACEAASVHPESYLKYGFEGVKNQETKVSLSPQPVAQGNEITLSAIGSDIAQVKMLSIQGTILWEASMTNSAKSIKIQSDFNPGIYLLEIKLSSGEVKVRKIAIQ